jgi:FAD/FMN-containing dehydrogenase/Fe-S oxidoreductase
MADWFNGRELHIQSCEYVGGSFKTNALMETSTLISEGYLAELNENIKGDVLADAYSLGLYSTDASFYQIIPLAVVLPMDDADVKAALKIADKFNLCVMPRGGGTSLAGQTVAEAIILDFSKYMNKILELNVAERWVRVQPGIVRDELNEVLAADGLHFAPDPATSSRANVGGMVGNNSSGTKSILYGKTVDHILEANVVLQDGTALHFKNLSSEKYAKIAAENTKEGRLYQRVKEVIDRNKEEIKSRYPKVMRRVGGYNLDEFVYQDDWNLSKLICGSEGTLAMSTALKINLEPLPKHKSVMVVHYKELNEAISSVECMLPFRPSAVEILDRTVLHMSEQNLTTKHLCHFIEDDPAAVLIVEFYGDTAADVLERPQKLIELLKKDNFGYAYPLFPDGKSYRDVWELRKKSFGLMLGLKGDKKALSFIEDAAIPIEFLPEYVEQVLAICKKYETEAAMYAHASVGVIHIQPLLDLRQKIDIERLKKITDETFELVVKYGGSFSGEHGDGLVRSPYNEAFFGSNLYQALKEIKKIFDPKNLMNPGKIVDSPGIDKNLRYGTEYKDAIPKTQFKYVQENSFQESVHMCTGVGECRKVLGGTMCPSFKATRDEEHSTRGRANALRMAMSGQLDEDGLASKRLHEVMDLCLSCKACKSECPSNVDMAKLKSDVQQLYFDKHGISLRDRLIRDSSMAASMFSGSLATLVNLFQKTSIFKSLLELFTGFDKRRTLPSYASEPFYKYFAKNKGNFLQNPEKRVVLFADTYLNFHETQIGISAVELLNNCGYEVILANVGCCQRPKISHGFLKDAKKEGTKTLEGLRKYLDQGLKVVVCEPSCASALTDDLPDLIDNERLTAGLSENIMMIDVFLQEEIKNGLPIRLTSESGDMLIHGHCHQKALFGTESMKNVEGKVNEIPSGCCGMAGSFGYEKEHYAISKKIGESILFPAVKNKAENTDLVACGFSCRHQIHDFTGVKAKHWVEVVKASRLE